MSKINRRSFLKFVGAGAAFAAMPPIVRAATTAPRVVVIGGGFGGATAAKYIKFWGGNVDVTLIDPNIGHTACILSNLVLTGQKTLDQITFSYNTLSGRGVNVIQDFAIEIDPGGRTVLLFGGARLPYDHLVLSPGIDFMSIPGWDENLVPHAWRAGSQTTLLQNQLMAMPAGGTFVMTIPKAPYRCPPGPYERACMVADYVQRNKPGAKVIVLDGNAGIIAEPNTFGNAFNQTYAGTIEYHTNVAINSVDSPNRIINTSIGAIQASVLNVIGPMQAGKIVRDVGLAVDPSARWAPVDPLTYASTVYPEIHVIGDSQATGQPKSGHMANAQAKVCADAIVRNFAGLAPNPAPATNSACFSPITANTASWLTVVFQYDSATRTMKSVPASFGEASTPSVSNYKRMFTWADSLFSDTFR